MFVRRFSFISATLALFTPFSAWSAPYSERHAFCVDRSFSLYQSSYSMQKRYNSCMKRADQLILEYEESSKRAEIEYRNRMKKQKEAERIRQRKVESEFDDVFGGFEILQID